MLLSLAMVFAGVTANAADNKFYYFYDEFHAYPSGAGKIYVHKDKLDDPSEITEWDE